MSEAIRASGTTEFIALLADVARQYPGVVDVQASENGIRIEYAGDQPRQTVIEALKSAVEARL